MSKDYRISEAFEHKGYFGPPHCKEMIAGILSYVPSEGIKLEWIGSIKDNIQEVFNKQEIDCIWGELDNGLLVTLFHCYSSFSINSACSFILERYSCNRLFIGANIESYSIPLYAEIQAEFRVLPFWCPPSAIESNTNLQWHTTTVKMNELPRNIVSVDIGNGRTLSLNESAGFNTDMVTHSETFFQSCFISLNYATKQTLFDLCRDIELFCDFMSFASLKLQACSVIKIIDEDRNIYAIYRPDIDESILPLKYVHDFLFSYEDIHDCFPLIISNWMNNSKSRPIISHLIDSITFRRVFTENDFLIIAQALDGYNKRFLHIGGHFNNVLNGMFKKYENLTIFHSDVFNGDSIAATRNYFAHLADESSIKNNVVRNGKKLYDMTQMMRKLLICYLMELVGFSIDDVEKITKKSTNRFII